MEKLPTEIHYQIIKDLIRKKDTSIFQLCQTNKYFYSICENDKKIKRELLKLKMELLQEKMQHLYPNIEYEYKLHFDYGKIKDWLKTYNLRIGRPPLLKPVFDPVWTVFAEYNENEYLVKNYIINISKDIKTSSDKDLLYEFLNIVFFPDKNTLGEWLYIFPYREIPKIVLDYFYNSYRYRKMENYKILLLDMIFSLERAYNSYSGGWSLTTSLGIPKNVRENLISILRIGHHSYRELVNRYLQAPMTTETYDKTMTNLVQNYMMLSNYRI